MDVNNSTGDRGLLAIDKRGCKALFLDPASYALLDQIDLPARPHELAISPDHRTAYVSIYGSGVYGNNPEPGHTLVTLDLGRHTLTGTLDLSPFQAPHGLMLSPDGRTLYVSCDQSGVVAIVRTQDGTLDGSIDVQSLGNHQITLLPDGSRIYSENEDQQPFVSVLDPGTRTCVSTVPIPRGALGICAAADGQRVLVADGQQPALLVIDTPTNTLVREVPLHGYQQPAQRVRCSPDGAYMMVTADQEPLATVLDAHLEQQTTFEVSPGPMGVAFHPDGRTALVANHGSGKITVVDLPSARPTHVFPMGVGVETLAFY